MSSFEFEFRLPESVSHSDLLPSSVCDYLNITDKQQERLWKMNDGSAGHSPGSTFPEIADFIEANL